MTISFIVTLFDGIVLGTSYIDVNMCCQPNQQMTLKAWYSKLVIPPYVLLVKYLDTKYFNFV